LTVESALEEIRSELVSAAGDPVAYRVRGALIALRREQAAWIRIERRPESTELAS
jgi:Fe2+ transport system protein FeoA